MNKRKLLLTAALVSNVLSVSNVMAMPKPTADITGLVNNVSLEGIGTVYGDHDDKKTVYVKPGNVSVTGQYAQINGSPSCQSLHRLREITHRYPLVQNFQKALDNTRFYSPAFEANVGFAARNSDLLLKSIEHKEEIQKYIQEHKEIYGPFKKTELILTTAKEKLDGIKVKIQQLQDDLVSSITMASEESERSVIRQNYRGHFNAYYNERKTTQNEVDQAIKDHAQNLEAWAPYADELAWNETVYMSIAKDFSTLKQLSAETFNLSKKSITALEQKVVGVSSVSYSLNINDKVAELNKRIQAKGLDYHAVPLNIFNVKANAIIGKSIEGVHDSMSGINYKLQGLNISKDLYRSIVTDSNEVAYSPMGSTVLDENGKREDFQLLLTDFDQTDASSMAFEMPVTMGSFCGYPKGKEVTYQYTTNRGETFQRTLTRQSYEFPNQNAAVFVQDVGLNYSYFVKAEPIKGSCTMNINKVSNFTRNSGSKTSWSWFRKSKSSWDNTRHDISKNMGINCSVTTAPQGFGPKDAKNLKTAMEMSLYQDIYSMFLLEYAKEYKIAPITHSDTAPAASQFFGRIGDGVMNLCGRNKMCQFTGVVLKSLDELVGRRHSGSTSNRTTSSGTINRKIHKDSFYMESDSLQVSMKVCVDKNKCD